MKIDMLVRSLPCLLLVAVLLTSCYPMPTEDDCSLVPSTNNPDVTRQRAESPLPQMPC